MNEPVDRGARVWRAGRGPVMVLLHGEFGDAPTYWRSIVGPVAERFDLILPDLPGFGESPPPADYRPLTYLLWLKQLVDASSPCPPGSEAGAARHRVVLGGVGFGATLARLFAARYPARVSRLILSGGGSLGRPPRLRRILSRIAPGAIGRGAWNGPRSPEDLFDDPNLYVDAEFRHGFERSRPAAERACRACAEAPLPPNLTPVCTTLLLWGNEDRYCPLAVQQAIAGEIADTRQVDIFEAGHLVTIEQPHRFSAHLLDFASSKQ
ncbi:MAG: alpha/beta fold hydrolase [Chloroflexota bacterium]